MNGWLLINKPKDWTSFDVVNKIRSLIAREIGAKPKTVKVGHSGTLDPQATGLLVLGIGKATKQIESKIKNDKIYEATIILGTNSSTGDNEGELTQISSNQPSEDEIEAILSNLTGEIMQTPPQYSAIKVDGVPAYKKARSGELVALKPRKVTIHSLSLSKYDYPNLDIKTEVSSGTYIRTLAEDIGKKLKTGAYLGRLLRTQVGNYQLTHSIDMEGIDFDIIKSHLIALDL